MYVGPEKQQLCFVNCKRDDRRTSSCSVIHLLRDSSNTLHKSMRFLISCNEAI